MLRGNAQRIIMKWKLRAPSLWRQECWGRILCGAPIAASSQGEVGEGLGEIQFRQMQEILLCGALA